ncbi:histidine kinase [Caballeronia jiangsuensis]|nr:histidine kinase [Caballeronia jiangsuensis]
MQPTKLPSASSDRWFNQSAVDIEHRYQLLIEAVQDYAIFMLDAAGCVQTWNPGAERIKGYASAEVVGRHFSLFYADEDIASGKPEHLLAIAHSRGHVEDEGWRVRKDGSRFWANVIITAITGPDGAIVGFAKVTRDMTERRRLEELERLQLRSALIQQAREAEQKRIARELHDDLGQRLSALKMSLAAHQTKLAQQGEEIADQIDAMAASLRRIAADLRPLGLDDLGLEAALEWLVESFERRYGINARLKFDGDIDGFNELTTISLYRVVQEALTNVARHANASEVNVDLSTDDRSCRLSIADDGDGLPASSPRAEAFGLMGMHERAEQLGGTLAIKSEPGVGVELTLVAPLARIRNK